MTQPHAAPAGDAPASRVAEDVWRVTTPMPSRPPEVHAYLAELGDGGWMLVDGGLNTDAAWTALEAGVLHAAGGWDAIRVHVVTHMHMDHVGLAARVREASGAAVWMGRLDAERMAYAAAHPGEEEAYRAALLHRCGAPAEMVRAVEEVRRGAEPLADLLDRADHLLRRATAAQECRAVGRFLPGMRGGVGHPLGVQPPRQHRRAGRLLHPRRQAHVVHVHVRHHVHRDPLPS
ncbi:MAG TPA: MBL fold metallo-hydrolase, partial [Longimicrobium sp.]|nr:MBL fold metallo-hydrolase [Longimicrobium sp.]